MSINSILKKEGITIVKKLDTLKVNTIAKSVASKLCLAFPEHNFNRSDLFSSFCRLNMYIADMPDNLGGAKYFYKNNSIYFSQNINSRHLPSVAVHECIHFIQEILDPNGNLESMGLYNLNSGLGFNEAAVQLMASEANIVNPSSEKYFDISLNTISPDYYPLECCLVNQITYFTGTYPLYHSTLNGNDVFKNTFVAKSNIRTFNSVIKNLDTLLDLENDLNTFIYEIQYTEKTKDIALLNSLIALKKKAIVSLFFKTQNLIMKSFLTSEFNSIRTISDLKDFKEKFYNFKDIIGTTNNYEFYNNFYRQMMENLEKKQEHIEQNGEINLFSASSTSLVLVQETTNAFSFISVFFKKIRKLFNKGSVAQNINQI